MLTEKQVKALKPKEKEYTVSDDTGSRREGRLVMRVRPNGTKEWVYVYYLGKCKKKVSVGKYPTLSLAHARDQVQVLAQVLNEGNDPGRYLRDQKSGKTESDERGALGLLIGAYIENMKDLGKPSYKEVEKTLERYVKKDFERIWNKEAYRVTSEDIHDILEFHIDRGITTSANRLRAYLHAAYQFGLTSEFNPRAKDKQKFGLKINPVSVVPIQRDWERQGKTIITPSRLQHVWHHINDATVRRSRMSYAVKLSIATAGQRISSLLRLEVSHIDLERGVIDFPAEIMKARLPHVTPINKYSEEVLKDLIALSDEKGTKFLFPSAKNIEEACVLESVSSHLGKYRKKFKSEHWTVRDIRRTAKTTLGELGVSKEMRDRLHGHAMHDVSSRHYDRYEYWKEKQEVMAVWENHLSKILF